jgi:hypothetical protein
MKAGKIADAATVSKDIVSQWQELAAEDETLLPHLARALGDLSARARRSGDPVEALDASVKSVRYWRVLADNDIERYGLDLSRALMGLGPLLARNNRPDWFTVRDEAARLLLSLLEIDEDKYLLPAAEACLWMAGKAGELGDPHKTRMYCEKAVALWRQLATKDLIRHGPQLVQALTYLSMEQIDAGGSFGRAPRR